MSKDIETRPPVPGRLKYVSAIAFLSILIPATIYGLALLYGYHAAPVHDAIEEQKSLFVSHSMTTSSLFALAGVVLMSVYIVIENLWKWIAGKSFETFLEKVMNWCGYAGIFCVFATVFGAPVFNLFWHDHFEGEGYSSCSNGILPLRTEIFYSVWVRNPQWCGDPEVQRILMEEGHGREGVAKANKYLN